MEIQSAKGIGQREILDNGIPLFMLSLCAMHHALCALPKFDIQEI
jgi:hypothetical protein